MARGPMPGQPARHGFKARKVDAPEPPDWLTGEALAEWVRIVPILLDMKMLTDADRIALAAYCQAVAELVECTAVLEKDGRFVEEDVQNSKGELIGARTKAHPALAAQRDAMGRVKAYLGEFGLSPSARARLRVMEDTGEAGGGRLAAILKTVADDAA